MRPAKDKRCSDFPQLYNRITWRTQRFIIPYLLFIPLFSLLFFAANRPCAANGVVLDSIGVTSSGRGGTNIAHSDNGVLIHDNPAALINMPAGKLLEFDGELIYPDIRYEDDHGADNSKHEAFILPSFSFVYKKAADSRFAFGAGVFAPAGFGTEYRLEHFMTRNTIAGDFPVSFGNHIYRSEASLIKLLASTSFKVNEKLSLGFSAGPSVQKVDLEMPYTFQTGALAGVSALGDMDTRSSFGFAYTAGVQYKITENTTVGLAYISESRSTLKGDATISLPDTAPESALFTNKRAKYDLESDFEWPRSIGIGITHKLGASHRFSSDVMWFDWASAFDSLDTKMTDGDNAEFNAALGNELKDSYPIDWSSAFSFRFGYEYFLMGSSDNIIRCGYLYNENPVSPGAQVPMIPGNVRHNVSVGYSHTWNKWEFGVASQYMFSEKDTVAESDILGGDFNNSSLDTKAYLLFLGVKYKF